MDKYILLIYKELKGTLDSEERVILNQWLRASDDNIEVKKDIIRSYESIEASSAEFPVDPQADYAILKNKLNINVSSSTTADHLSKTNPVTKKPSSIFSMRIWKTIAASLVLLVGAMFLFNSIIYNQGGEWLSYEHNGLNTDPIELSDGSKVWLNEKSTLLYREGFSTNSRDVILEGEGFFEVKPDKKKPFIISTPKAEITVLGTAFNINASDLENTTVSVQSGKVLFTDKSKMQKTILTADMSARLNHNSNILKIQEKNSGNHFLWHTDRMSFKSSTLPEVFTTLESYFDIKINNENKSLNHCMFSMTPQKPNLNRVLENLKKIYNVTITKEDKVYHIVGGTCN